MYTGIFGIGRRKNEGKPRMKKEIKKTHELRILVLDTEYDDNWDTRFAINMNNKWEIMAPDSYRKHLYILHYIPGDSWYDSLEDAFNLFFSEEEG